MNVTSSAESTSSLEQLMSNSSANDSLPDGSSTPVATYNGIMQKVFEILVIIIGVIGMNANVLVLYALCVTQNIKRHVVNILFINQMSVDLFSCVWVVVTYCLKLANIYLTGSTGYWLCIFILAETFIYIGLLCSSFNLAAIAVERCIKIAHPFWHKTHVRPWIVFTAVVITWTVAGIAILAPTLPTTVVIDGQCYVLAKWQNPVDSFAFGVQFFVCNFVLVLLIFVVCYGRILVTVRKQARVLAVQYSNNPLGMVGQKLTNRIQMNIVKLMAIVTGLFVVCLGPIILYNFIATTVPNVNFQNDNYYILMFVAFLNSCLNPFIYALKYDTVKQYLVRLMSCHQHSETQIASTELKETAH